MAPDASTTTVLAPLEAHADAQVKHLLAVVDVIRELQSTEAQYGKGYAKLPFQLPVSTTETLRQIPQLRGVCSRFSLLVYEFASIKANLATDLSTEVLEPLEVFTTDHGEKARHLLSELYELLQKEKAFDLAYQQLHEDCISQGSNPPQENLVDNESSPTRQDESTNQLQQTHMMRLLRKRDAERLTIQQWITALHFASQRYEAQLVHVVNRTTNVYERMITSSRTLLGRLQEQLSQEIPESSSSIGVRSNNSSTITSDGSWEAELARYNCHVTLTSWMGELFRQMVPVEQKTARLLQKVVTLGRAANRKFVSDDLSFHLTGLIEYHGLLTVNIANPIVRTLKFSKEKQERMQKELVKTLEETHNLVVDARARVDIKSSASKEQSDEEQTPIRRDSMTSSETSEICESDNNEKDQSGSDLVQDVETSSEWTPEHSYLQTMERKLALQTQEMTRVLQQTSYLAVKTMELMVQDHIKHVCNALHTLTGAMHMEPKEAKRNASDKARPWDHIAEMLSIDVAVEFVVQGENQSQQVCRWKRNSKASVVATRAAIQRLRRRRFDLCVGHLGKSLAGIPFGHFAANAIQFALCIVCWAAAVPFKFARYHLPPSQEERVVIAVILVAIVVMINICTESTRMQQSWRDLADVQRSNSQDLEQIAKLALDLCTSKKRCL